MVHASLFSGIGGPEVAAAMLGWENAFHCEINPFGKAVLDYWFPDSKSYEDITKNDFKEWRGKIDVLTGGFPCQPFSYAGRRGGAEDSRYLWPEMLRVINEVRPTWVVGENVAGLATMVEGGVFVEVGSEGTIFGEGDILHRYELRQTFTIERICRDLERLGYTVQPVLIPAAAVGAPHRRDRIFILAFDADTYGSDDKPVSEGDEGKGREERLQERHTILQPGIADKLRSEVQGTVEDSQRNGRNQREAGKQRSEWEQWDTCTGDDERICGKKRSDASDTDSKGRQEPQRPEWSEDTTQANAGMDDRVERPCSNGKSANTVFKGLEGEDQPGCEERGERVHLRRDIAGHDWQSLRPEERWANFPTVSPVHAGNDGIPLRMDGISIPLNKWRTESLKAYGNAIVPQVMYRIFQAIENI